METVREEAIVTIVHAWYPDIKTQEEIKEMVGVYRIIKDVKDHGKGRVTISVEDGEIKPGYTEVMKRI